MTTAFWVCAIITLASALTSLGFSVYALNSSTGAARNNSMYTTARSLALAIAAIIVLFDHSRGWLEAIATVMIVVQAADAYIGVAQKEANKVYGPAITALVNLIALVWFIGT